MSTDTIITTAVANEISKMALSLDTLTGNAILRDLSPAEARALPVPLAHLQMAVDNLVDALERSGELAGLAELVDGDPLGIDRLKRLSRPLPPAETEPDTARRAISREPDAGRPPGE